MSTKDNASNLFPQPGVGKWIIVIDARGTKYEGMKADEYAARVLGTDGIKKMTEADIVVLMAPDAKSGTILKNRGGVEGLVEIEMVQGMGHGD